MKLLFICIYLIVLIGIPLFEFIVKRKIRNNKEKEMPYKISKGYFMVHYQTNTGPMLGMLKKNKILVRVITSVMLTLQFGCSFYILFLHKNLYVLKIALYLLSGGAFGNTIERFKYGYVIDYFSFPKLFIRKVRNIVFNFSDIGIFIGRFMSLIFLIIYI